MHAGGTGARGTCVLLLEKVLVVWYLEHGTVVASASCTRPRYSAIPNRAAAVVATKRSVLKAGIDR